MPVKERSPNNEAGVVTYAALARKAIARISKWQIIASIKSNKSIFSITRLMLACNVLSELLVHYDVAQAKIDG